MKQWLSTFILIVFFSIASVNALQLQERQFDQQAMQDFKDDPDFAYSQNYVPANSFFGTLLSYLRKIVQGFFTMLGNQGLGQVLFNIIIIAGLIITVLLILRIKFGPALARKSRKFGNLPVPMMENEVEDYEELLQENLKKNQYKMAIRYLFLSLLSTLEKQRSIEVAKWKAPYDYIKEVPGEKRKSFISLADLFESTWYGNYIPDHDEVENGLQLYELITSIRIPRNGKV